MRTIIAGSRNITNEELLGLAIDGAIKAGFDITHVIEGGAKGVDEMGWRWAMAQGIPFTTVNAEWNRMGRAAGPLRNAKMSLMADALICIWDGKSPGTANMIEHALDRKLKVFVLVWPEEV